MQFRQNTNNPYVGMQFSEVWIANLNDWKQFWKMNETVASTFLQPLSGRYRSTYFIADNSLWAVICLAGFGANDRNIFLDLYARGR